MDREKLSRGRESAKNETETILRRALGETGVQSSTIDIGRIWMPSMLDVQHFQEMLLTEESESE